jgi:phosphoribosyl 1,2-cyclic phosphodiesterase
LGGILPHHDTEITTRKPSNVLKFSLLGSGSSGNASLIISDRSKILIDCGFSFKRLEERLNIVGHRVEDLDAVFVTHEHGDHVQCLGTLARKTEVPVYITRDTYENLPQKTGKLPKIEHFVSGDTIKIGDMTVVSFNISHDAADPVSFTVQNGSAKIGFATDMGKSSNLVRERLAYCHALVLESNYCPDMLRLGPYPPQIQQRIRNNKGHLSNQDMNSLLGTLLHDELQRVVLIHISESNNSHELARKMASHVVRDHPAKVVVAMQDEPTPLFEVG